MKKTVLFASFLLGFSFFSKAQVVINAVDINPQVGTVLYQTTDTLIDPSIVITPAGSGQTWDFSLLSNDKVDTLTFINPSSAPLSSNFPAANLCLSTQSNGSLSYIYLQKTSSKLDALGNVMDNPFNPGNYLALKMNPPMNFINFPAMVGSGTVTSYYKFKVQFSGAEVGASQFDSIRITTSGKRMVTPDADGVLTTPEASFNVLRVETISHDTTVIAGKLFSFWSPLQTNYDTSYNYDFWSTTSQFPAVSLSYDHKTQQVTGAQWLTTNPLGIKNTNSNQNIFTVAPNPSSGRILINAQIPSNVKVFDTTGKIVYQTDITQGVTGLNLTDLPNGIYQILYTTNTGTQTNKILINK